VAALDRPATGWSNETLLATLGWRGGSERLVVRLPPVVKAFPVHDLAAQAAVQRALHDQGLPVARPVAVVADERWLGAPFFVMAHSPGRPIGEVPALDPWLIAGPRDRRRRVHEGFVDGLARVHSFDWEPSGLAQHLRGADGRLEDEVLWWIGYIGWSADGRPTERLRDRAAWCLATCPDPLAPPTLCWGDARLGNVMYDDDGVVTAILDWELATIGPPEMDLAWYLALDGVLDAFVGRAVPDFLDRATLVDRYEAALGRPTEHLAWHEVFALVRSIAISERLARLAAAAGVRYHGVAGDENPLLDHVDGLVARLEGR
jgi:aminoglycoside phosphotransferase (APT) family kinase protein